MEFNNAEQHQDSESSIWVFGYGSLCWNPGFEYHDSKTGYIKGYSRKFWQGNDQHRGTKDNPGRVATLVEESDGIVWGRAFLVCGQSAIPYLNTREGILGGYMTSYEHFYTKDHDDSDPNHKPIKTMIFIACPSNSLWLGEAPLHEIADQVVSCRGPSGHNAEYVLRLAIFMRENITDAHKHDPDLFTLEIMLLNKINENKLCMFEIMGEAFSENTPSSSNGRSRPNDFTARLPVKSLRCVNIN